MNKIFYTHERMGSIMRSFASDNNSGIHPEILQSIMDTNQDHAIAYGNDPYTLDAVECLREEFGEETGIYFVYGGTAANVLGLKQITASYHSILCAETAHIQNDECGAPERFTGNKLLTIPSSNGKITPASIKPLLQGIGFEHHAQPRVISISQATEMGTVYTPGEIRAIADFAHQNQLLLHMDGARLCNAAASLGTGLRQLSADAGVDVLSFGGAKNGMLVGECVIFFDKTISETFKYTRKQGMQLMAKMRFIAAQFIAYFSDDLWLRNASHANAMAKLLEESLHGIPQIRFTQPVETNAVFAIIPKDWIPIIQEKYFFYVWKEDVSEVRWMTSYDTTKEDIQHFTDFIRNLSQKHKG